MHLFAFLQQKNALYILELRSQINIDFTVFQVT